MEAHFSEISLKREQFHSLKNEFENVCKMAANLSRPQCVKPRLELGMCDWSYPYKQSYYLSIPHARYKICGKRRPSAFALTWITHCLLFKEPFYRDIGIFESSLMVASSCSFRQQTITWNILIDGTYSLLYPTVATLIARFIGPTWCPPKADRTQVGPILAPWVLLSGNALKAFDFFNWPKRYISFKRILHPHHISSIRISQ